MGRIAKQADKANSISISELPPAVYFVKVFDEQGVLICQEKVVKK
jgi:hypothetical protein